MKIFLQKAIIERMKFKPTCTDPCACVQCSKRKDGTDCCKHSLIHVDNLLIASEDPKKVVDKPMFPIKEGSAGLPMQHLGALCEMAQTPSGLQ